MLPGANLWHDIMFSGVKYLNLMLCSAGKMWSLVVKILFWRLNYIEGKIIGSVWG